MEKKNNAKIIVIGLDGGSWNVLMPLIKEGKLPTFRKIVKKGAYGYLKSITPPISVPAWKCYSTGKSPGKLGVYGFLKIDLERRTHKVVTPADFNGKDVWDVLGKHDMTSCIFKMFSTYPAKKIRGCMVSEFPGENGFYPKDLKKELEDLFGSLWYDVAYSTDRDRTYLNVVKEMKKNFEVTRYLIEKNDPDFTHMTISYTDGVQHFFWKDMMDEDVKYGKYIENFWIEIDKQMDKFVEFLEDKYGENLYIFLMSDHGFYDVKFRFNMGKWLVDKGYLKLNSKSKCYRAFFMLFDVDKIYSLVEYSIKFQKKFRSKKEVRWGEQFKLSSKFISDIIDWERSKIIPLEGQLLYVNGRQREREDIISKITDEITKIRTPEGYPLVKKIIKGKEFYGVFSAPDVIILPEKIQLYNSPLTNTLWSKPAKDKWTGMHDTHGIFVAHGKGIRSSEIKNAKIVDIAPTLLHIFGIPIPDYMEGRVLKEIFKEGSEFSKRPVSYEEPGEKEKRNLKQKIKDLKIEGRI